MNDKQEVVLWIGTAIFVLMSLFPPWLYTYDALVYGLHTQKPIGYFWLFSKPQPSDSNYAGVSIDCSRLLIQWAIVVVVTVGLIYIFKDKKDKKAMNKQKQ